MKDVGRFEIVSFPQFLKGIERFIDEKSPLRDMKQYLQCDTEYIKTNIYNKIKLPQRSTYKSAGYDFFYPFEDTILLPGETIIIPTGIRCYIVDEWYLGIYPKSGLSFDYKVRLDDTIAIIDGDYYEAENEGHIYLKLTNENKYLSCRIPQGSKIVQGIFKEYGLVENDNCTTRRTGGMGHTDHGIRRNHKV